MSIVTSTFTCVAITHHTMSFVATSQSFWLENGHILHAQCRDTDGNWKDSTIDLNQFIGNSDGWFVWDGVSKSTLHMPAFPAGYLSI